MGESPNLLASVLLADRDADTRLMYAEYLRHLAYDVDEAEDGREALAKAIARRPNVIVTETRLPGISGLELCRLLRHDEATRVIPIVVVTGDAFANNLRLAEMAGADAVLVKPCLPEKLANQIQAVLSVSFELRDRTKAIRSKLFDELARSDALVEGSRATVASRRVLSHTYDRRETDAPPAQPPSLECPSCHRPLKYVKSHIGGVNERQAEQWDYFECPAGCGTYQYRQRTRRIRLVTPR